MGVSFDDAKLNLLREQPFFAALLNRLRIIHSKDIPTIGVGLAHGKLSMIVNDEFFNSLTDLEQVGILIHEMLHLTMRHVARRESYPNKKLGNIAQDIAINQWIDRKLLPKEGMFPETFGLKKGLTSYEYYNELYDKYKDNADQLGNTLDEHDLQVEIDEDGNVKVSDGEGQEVELPESVRQQLMKAINDSAQETKADYPKKWGNTPEIVKNIIKDIEKLNKANWKGLLKQFIGTNQSKAIESTRNKANRRLGLKAMGNKREYIPNILIAIDQSGSVSDGMIAAFFQEIRSILGTLNDGCEVIFFDTQVAQSVSLKGLNDVKKLQRYATGGTDFSCVFNHARKKKYDMVLVMTDGEALNPNNMLRSLPTLWAIPEGYRHDHLTGRKIAICLEKK